MGFIDTDKQPLIDRQTGEQVREVSILNEGAKWLIGRMMKTSDGFKMISRISPYKYKACTVHFQGGTFEQRDFDETFRIRVNEEDNNACI